MAINKKIHFRHMEADKVITDYVNTRIAKIEQFLENEPTPVYVDVTIEPSKTREHHRVELRIKSPNYDLIHHYEHNGVKFYDLINYVCDAMYQNLQDAKEKRVSHNKQGASADPFKK